MKNLIAVPALTLAAALICFGCGKKNEYVPPPPPEVTAALPVEREVTDFAEATGTTEGVESIELRARVKGFLQQMNYTPGLPVAANDLLFQIDPSEYRIKRDRAAAEVAVREAEEALAIASWKRQESAFQKNAVSELVVLQARAERDRAIALTAEAKAALEAAKLDLGYTEVRAPFGGIAGQNLKNIGDLVGASEQTLLTTFVNDNQVTVRFSVSESEILEIRDRRQGGGGADIKSNPVPVQLGISNETGYPHEGRVDSIDNQIDPVTGTFTIKAIFENPGRKIPAGAFVRLRIPLGQRRSLLVPSVAVQLDQQGSFVYFVNDKNVVERRGVTTGPQLGDFRRVDEGLRADERVIVNGIQRARAGAPVTPQMTELKVPETAA